MRLKLAGYDDDFKQLVVKPAHRLSLHPNTNWKSLCRHRLEHGTSPAIPRRWGPIITPISFMTRSHSSGLPLDEAVSSPGFVEVDCELPLLTS
jgi:hypothetical protein